MVAKAVRLHRPHGYKRRLVTKIVGERLFGYRSWWLTKAVWLQRRFGNKYDLVTNAVCLPRPFGDNGSWVTRAVSMQRPFGYTGRLKGAFGYKGH